MTSIRKSGDKEGEDKPDTVNVSTVEPYHPEDVEAPSPEDPDTDESSTEITLSGQQQIVPPSSPKAKVKRSPTMKERITSLPRRIINKMSMESGDGPEEKNSADSKCEVDQGKYISTKSEFHISCQDNMSLPQKCLKSPRQNHRLAPETPH